MPSHAFTSFSYSYLNRARVLARTIKRLHPEWVLWAVITDHEPDGFSFDLDEEDFDRILTFEALFGEGMNSWLFGHDIVEACTAVKGRAAVHILSIPECEKLLYFDPDIALLNSMEDVVSLLDDYSIVLTPHQIDPEPRADRTAIMDNEIASLDYGSFNLGFVAIANDDEGRRFAQWWDDRLRDWCHDRLDIGLFVDQKWCNLVPCFFDNVKILRDPGYNVASWNLSQRKMHFDSGGQLRINNLPLRFYHFTKLGAVGDTMTQRYAKDNTEVYELWWWYKQQVIVSTSKIIPKGWWHFGKFENGVEIRKSVREIYRDRFDIQNLFPEPFKSKELSCCRWLHENLNIKLQEKNNGRYNPV